MSLKASPTVAIAADGSLAPRSEPGAVLHDRHEIEEQVVRLAGGAGSQRFAFMEMSPALSAMRRWFAWY